MENDQIPSRIFQRLYILINDKTIVIMSMTAACASITLFAFVLQSEISVCCKLQSIENKNMPLAAFAVD